MLVLALHILGYDIWFYLSHIILHLPWMYRKIHHIHHEIAAPRYKDTYHGHWFEGPFQSIGFLLPFACGYDFDLLQFTLGLLLVNARGMIRHETRLARWFGNHHLIHHRAPNCNFGEYWLDRVFGTDCKKKESCSGGLLRLYF
jgi:sterol desaturase/sphingolipid hydroxylase (fatty acid hydroxylase superfamily)